MDMVVLQVVGVAVFNQERDLVLVNNPFSCVLTACFVAMMSIPFTWTSI